MAYTDNFPQRPVFMADFANGGRIDPRATFSRSDTPPTYAAPSAVHYWSNEKHLSSENILLQSQTLNTTWAAVDIAAPSGSQTAPDGTSTAWLLTAQTGSSKAPYVRQSPTFSGSTQYTMVGHLKAGTASHGYISFRTQNGYSAYALLDFSGGTVSHAGFGDFTGVTSSVTALGSSWFKVTLTATTGSNLSSSNVAVGISDGTTPTSAGYAVWSASGETMYSWGIQLASTNAKVYDSPTTTQISRSYASSLKSVATAGQPRFEYDPSSDGQSAAKGILIEQQSTNLATYSSDITQSFYTAFRSARESNVAVAPDGTLTADLLREDSSSGNSHGVYFEYASGGTTAQTISVYAKAAGRNHLSFRFDTTNGVFGSDFVYFNLNTGAVGTTDSDITASIESCGNGWYRCIATRTALASANGRIVLYLADADNSTSYDGDSYSGVLLWGIQAEANSSHASSLVSTSGASATRAAESLSVTDSSLFGTGSGSVVVEAGPVNGTFYPTLFDLTDTTTSNRVLLQSGGTGTPTSLTVAADGNASVGVVSEAVTMSDRKFAVSYDTNSFKLVNNGGAVSEDTSGQLPQQLSKLNIGTDNGGGGPLNGNIKRIAVFGEPLSDTNLQAITS